jgi:hypothetical protein
MILRLFISIFVILKYVDRARGNNGMRPSPNEPECRSHDEENKGT